MTDYGIKDLLGEKRCPKCNAKVILIWTAKGKTFKCAKCKNKLAEQPYVVLSSSKGDEQ